MNSKTFQPVERLHATFAGRPIGVDRGNKIVRGVVLAQQGDFKTGRGSFNLESLRKIQQLAAADPKGLRSYFRHPNANDPDPLGRFLGRVKDPFMSTVTVDRNGEKAVVHCVRGDLHLDPASFSSPGGQNYGDYIMSLAESDPDALSASLVLRATKVRRDLGPPTWYPTEISGLDIVTTGDATDGLLSAPAGGELALAIGSSDDELRMRWRHKLRTIALREAETKRKAGVS